LVFESFFAIMSSNPFDDPNPGTAPFGYEPPAHTIASSPGYTAPPPTYGYANANPDPLPNPFGTTSYYAPPPPPLDGAAPAYGGSYSEESLRQRSIQLDQREANLAAREASLAAREARLGRDKPPNWPRWPKPIIHQDIKGEIPESSQKTVRLAYIGWFATAWALVWNLVVMTGSLAVAGAVGDFILAIVYVLLWTPLSFMTFRCLYRGARRRKGSYYVFYLFFLGISVLAHILWAVGIKGSGMGGFLWMIYLFNHGQQNGQGSKGGDYIVAILCLLSTFFWIASVFYFIYTWNRARLDYRSLGGNAQARREATSEAASQMAQNPDAVTGTAKYASNSL